MFMVTLEFFVMVLILLMVIFGGFSAFLNPTNEITKSSFEILGNVGTFIMVPLTALMIYQTYQVLLETRRDRKISMLNEKLGKVYSPLMYMDWAYYLSMDEMSRFRSNMHLSSAELRPILLEYLDEVYHRGIYSVPPGEGGGKGLDDKNLKHIALVERLKRQVAIDFDKYHIELKSLSKS